MRLIVRARQTGKDDDVASTASTLKRLWSKLAEPRVADSMTADSIVD